MLAVLLVGILAACDLEGGEFKNSKDTSPSSVSPADTSTKPIGEQSLPQASENGPDNINCAESKEHIEDTLNMLEEMVDVLNSLDTVRDQELIAP